MWYENSKVFLLPLQEIQFNKLYTSVVKYIKLYLHKKYVHVLPMYSNYIIIITPYHSCTLHQSIFPVSYTHLDVYKRQVQERAVLITINLCEQYTAVNSYLSDRAVNKYKCSSKLKSADYKLQYVQILTQSKQKVIKRNNN